MIILIALFSVFALSISAINASGLEIGFPPGWNGDELQMHPCDSKDIPTWMDGYFLIQTCAAYGKQSDPPGHYLRHMFEALGAVASIEISNGKVKFSARYYPTKAYKIWNFYGRNWTESTVAWYTGRSVHNLTSIKMWDHINDDSSFPTHPNVDFWQIGKTVLGATEFVGVGMKFDVPTLTNFEGYPFKDNNDIFRYRNSVIPMAMPVHERVSKDGSLYAAFAAYDPTKYKMYEMIFKVTPDGTRTLEGTFDHGTYDPSLCSPNGTYTGDKKVLAGYMHSITSTDRYVILPLTSHVFNPCKLPPLLSKYKPKQPPLPEGLEQDFTENTFFATDVPVRFLVFDKIDKKFVTDKPIESPPATFITHQFNAYEDSDGTLVADMIGDTREMAGYNRLIVENLLSSTDNFMNGLWRFRINLRMKTVTRKNLLADKDLVDVEFSNYNRNFQERKYKYGYMLMSPFRAGGKIAKINVDDGRTVAEFGAPGAAASTTAFREPWFVPRSDASVDDEDNGVILTIGGDVATGNTTLYVLDGKTLTLLGRAEIPTFVPFGFHNRFYSKKDL